jgi:hypothetical protein
MIDPGGNDLPEALPDLVAEYIQRLVNSQM